MAAQKFADLHRTCAASADADFQRFLFLLPVRTPRGGNRVVIGVAHHPRKALCALAGQHHVVGHFHHLARDQDRVLHPLQRGDRADLVFVGQHHAGIELDKAVEIQHRTGAGVEDRIVFQHHRGRAGRIERGAAGFEDLSSRGHGRGGAGDGVIVGTRAPGAGAAVNDQGNGHVALSVRDARIIRAGKFCLGVGSCQNKAPPSAGLVVPA